MLKLYHFDPQSWGTHYTMMECSPKIALQRVKDFLKKKKYKDAKDREKFGMSPLDLHEYDIWKDATIDSLPEKYRIIEADVGEIVTGQYN